MTGFSESWRERLVSDCVFPLDVDRHKKVLARDYKAIGKFPIVDQGQGLIAGRTDDETAVITDLLPVVVFGDHTRVFKFVDFPFVIGADGTKLLKPISELDPKFFYFACLALDIPSRGYNRHFKILREQLVQYPELLEQQKIAAVLWKIQRAVEIEDAIVRNARDLKKSLLRRLFTHGLRGEALKETEIGPLPQSWEVSSIGGNCEIRTSAMSYGELLATAASKNGVLVQGVKVSDMNLPGNEIRFESANLVKRIPLAVSKRRTIPPKAIVFPKRGAAIATNKKRFTTTWTVLDPNLIAVIPSPEIEPSFLLNWLMTFDLTAITEPGLTPQLNKKNIEPIPFPKPAKAEQREIADILQAVDRKIDIHESKKRSLQELFKTTLHKLMTAQIRVNHLDIDTTGMESGTR